MLIAHLSASNLFRRLDNELFVRNNCLIIHIFSNKNREEKNPNVRDEERTHNLLLWMDLIDNDMIQY